jgi:hypothetical protein
LYSPFATRWQQKEVGAAPCRLTKRTKVFFSFVHSYIIKDDNINTAKKSTGPLLHACKEVDLKISAEGMK